MTDGDMTLDPAFQVPHVDYFDLDASYAFSAGPLQGLELRAGVENLTDEDPPIFPSIVQANTDPSQYDVFGRRYYASLRYSLLKIGSEPISEAIYRLLKTRTRWRW